MLIYHMIFTRIAVTAPLKARLLQQDNLKRKTQKNCCNFGMRAMQQIAQIDWRSICLIPFDCKLQNRLNRIQSPAAINVKFAGIFFGCGLFVCTFCYRKFVLRGFSLRKQAKPEHYQQISRLLIANCTYSLQCFCNYHKSITNTLTSCLVRAIINLT